ncbi:MAG TPA: OmpH family outer membrane protein [Opitutaceae bacterium]|nr:OmpH family outer membrane protein [Opitutaceae bacterium]
MKNIIRTFVAAATLSLGAGVLSAQAPFKLVVVDMAKVFDNHYKKAEADAKFRESEQNARQDLEQMTKQGQSLVDEFRALEEQSKNAVLTAEARSKAEADAQAKVQEIQRLQQRMQDYRQQAGGQLQQRIKNHRELLLEEISGVVRDLARKKGATLVLDKAGPSLFGISNVIYADAAYDITEEVLAEVNKDRPPTAPTPAPAPATGGAATPSPAAPATPAPAGSSPLFNPPAPKRP